MWAQCALGAYASAILPYGRQRDGGRLGLEGEGGGKMAEKITAEEHLSRVGVTVTTLTLRNDERTH